MYERIEAKKKDTISIMKNHVKIEEIHLFLAEFLPFEATLYQSGAAQNLERRFY